MTDWAAIKGNTEEKIKRWSKKSGSAGGVGGGGSIYEMYRKREWSGYMDAQSCL